MMTVMISRVYRWNGLGFLTMAAAVATLVWPISARASNLDEELVRKAPRIMKSLREQSYNNVGVLNFRFNKDVNNQTRRPTFHAGLINSSMASRLENALILCNNPDKPVGIIHEAGLAAARLRNASYRTPDERQKLFQGRYPLAWGNQQVVPDAFLTGKVTLSKDHRTLLVSVEIFDRKNPGNIKEMLSFPVKTDFEALVDCGQGFMVSRRLKFRRDLDPNDIIVSTSGGSTSTGDGTGTTGPDTGTQTTPTTSGSDSLVSLEILFNGTPQALVPDMSAPDNVDKWDLTATPGKGDKVTFKLKNLTEEKLAVILIANNQNTLYEEKVAENTSPLELSRWILEPQKEYLVKGYYQPGNTQYKECLGFSDEESEQMKADLGGETLAGKIQMIVLRGGGEAGNQLAFEAKRSMSLKKLPARQARVGSARSLKDLQRLVVRRGIHSARGLVAPGETKEETLQEDKLDNPMPVRHMVVTYYKFPMSTSTGGNLVDPNP